MAVWGKESFWMNLATLGAHGRIEEREKKYRARLSQLRELLHQVERMGPDVARKLDSLAATKIRALQTLEEVRKISKNLSLRRRTVTSDPAPGAPAAPDLSRIEKVLEQAREHRLFDSSVRGIGAGASTAASAWFLVGAAGVASTGASIGGLSGAAATSATLAWFGGGAVAAGGGGIALGSAVLGGLVALPAVVVYGFVSHGHASDKIRQIATEEAKLVQSVAEARTALLKMEAISHRAHEIEIVLRRKEKTFRAELELVHSLMNRTEARFQRFVRRLFRRPAFTPADVEAVSKLLRMVSSLAKVIDQKVLDENGNVL